MRIVAENETGRRLTEFVLGHGDDPADELRRRGLRLVRPIEAVGTDDALTVRLLAESGSRRPRRRRRRRSPRPAPEGTVVRQRVAAYAWVRSSRGVLAAEYHRHLPDGRWTLPGGGIDPGEEATAAVHREVMEETSQRIELGELIAINTSRRIGSRNGEREDFHAVRLIYRADCPDPTDPVVIDVGGSTSDATWFPYENWLQAPWTPGWRALLTKLSERTAAMTDAPSGKSVS
ncbi:NUDIX hydrolase [Microlunatus soli]|uniref:ADP-ribose pyrophosphatase YjhB, NUDIX family n=1 Tax=Microlunatus soli TaxID=630515 RepID=A0A1H1QUI7_9ACTN|nr:NUDIX domain-containing protein [Microlunatus soli]SDS27130.1 ADP-ribose pyrophosphatase YjhB, NUDIX family [Microlunatus soli]